MVVTVPDRSWEPLISAQWPVRKALVVTHVLVTATIDILAATFAHEEVRRLGGITGFLRQ